MKTLWMPILVLLSACSGAPTATGPLFTPPLTPSTGQALVVLYRVNAFGAHVAETQVYADGHSLAAIRNASYSWGYVIPGRYTFTQVLLQCEVVPLVINVSAGQTLYLRADFEFNLTHANRCLLVNVPTEQALQELALTHSLGRGEDIAR